MTNATKADFQEWLRLAEQALSAIRDSGVDVSVNPSSDPAAWLAKTKARQR